jgi:hypothetical protein
MATKVLHNNGRGVLAGSTRGIVALLAALAGCESIEQDDFVYQGGMSPDPTAIIEGSVLYIGPRPTCERDERGAVARIKGNVVLTMFAFDNPPPPEGSAASALNLYVASGDRLFDVADCLPAGAAPDYAERITRSLSFRWPGVVLYNKAADYQIRGFFDYDEDMIPLFSVTRLPTHGDIAGAAVNDIQDASKGFLKITLPALEDAENGVVTRGVTVALGNPVWTERPAFRLDDNRRLAANTPFAPSIDLATRTANGPQSLRDFRLRTCATPGATDGAACGLTLQRLGSDDAAKMATVGVQVQVDDASRYAFFAEPIDIRVVNKKPEGSSNPSEGLDVLGADGQADPHPFLGSGLGIPWYSPLVIMQRVASSPAASALEATARIPRVLLVGSVLLGDDNRPTKNSYVESGVPVAIPPVAAVELVPGVTECRVPYFPPGTSSLVTSGRLGHCAELPTGHYATNVLAGIAGGVPGAPADPLRSESPVAVSGGRYSGQSWSIPNELGDANQVPATSVVPSQGIDGSFVIHDPTPRMAEDCGVTAFKGACLAGPEVSENAEGVDSTLCLDAEKCCGYVSHLCGIPVCEPVLTADGNLVASPTNILRTAPNGAGVPNCVPFELPPQCCPPATP